RIVSVFLPGAVRRQFDQSLQADMPHTRRHATGLHREPSPGLVAAFDSWKTGDAFFGRPCRAAIKGFLVRTCLHAFSVSAAPFLIHQYNAVLGPLIDGVPRTGGQATGIRAVV